MELICAFQLLGQLEIDELDIILREKRLCWFGHVERSSGAYEILQIDGKRGLGPPKISLGDIDRERPL